VRGDPTVNGTTAGAGTGTGTGTGTGASITLTPPTATAASGNTATTRPVAESVQETSPTPSTIENAAGNGG